MKPAAKVGQGSKPHVPGDINHKFLGAAGYDFCSTCGESLRGKRTLLEVEMLEALETAVLELHEVNLANKYRNRPRNPELTIHAEEVANAAIRKARGKQ